MARKHLLYLGNGREMQSVAKLDERFEGWDLSVDRHWAYDGQFPDSLDGYDGVFLSGSPHGAYENIDWILREHDLIRNAAEKDIPMLGVCFGQQILASALCGRDQVFRRSSCEIGYEDLIVTDAAETDPLACDLGPPADHERQFAAVRREARRAAGAIDHKALGGGQVHDERRRGQRLGGD